VLANVVVLPLATKLHAHLERRQTVMQMIIDGTLMVQRKEYPTRIEQMLRGAFALPTARSRADHDRPGRTCGLTPPPRIAATFLEEDSNGWLVTFSDLVLQLFAFVMVAAVLGTSSVTSLSRRDVTAERTLGRRSAPRAPPRPAAPTADALSLARFDDLPPRPPAPRDRARRRSRPRRRRGRRGEPEPVDGRQGGRGAGAGGSLATELESFVVAEGLEDAVQVAVNGGGVTLSISDTIGFASGSAELLPDANPVLAEIRGLVGVRPDLVVEVSGHTDDRPLHTGAFRSNLDLSLAGPRASRTSSLPATPR
jgi:flagellar motor protein MotB